MHTNLQNPGSYETRPLRTPCQWENGLCNVQLDDVSAAGIIRHLKAFHFDPNTNPWHNKNRGVCRWGGNCDSGEMNFENMGKHVAAVHLGSTARECGGCGKLFARPDTLNRHLAENCPAR